jgi:hypothetical protein
MTSLRVPTRELGRSMVYAGITNVEKISKIQGMRTGFVERTGKLEDMDRSFDLKFWQSQSDTQRFSAAWELVVQASIIKGRDVSQLRLQRAVEHFERQGR